MAIAFSARWIVFALTIATTFTGFTLWEGRKFSFVDPDTGAPQVKFAHRYFFPLPRFQLVGLAAARS